jgi:hypothetical protein
VGRSPKEEPDEPLAQPGLNIPSDVVPRDLSEQQAREAGRVVPGGLAQLVCWGLELCEADISASAGTMTSDSKTREVERTVENVNAVFTTATPR